MTTPALRAAVAALIEELTGITADQLDPATPLAELGLDSLTLTQLASRLQRRFAITIGFREFFTTTRTIDAVCARIAASGTAPAADAPAPARDAAAPASTAIFARAATGEGAAAIVPMMVAQLELMAAQLQAVAAAEGIALPVAPRDERAGGRARGSRRRDRRGTSSGSRRRDDRRRGARRAHAASGGRGPAVRRGVEPQDRQVEGDGRRAARGPRRPAHRESGFNPVWKEIVYPIVVERSRRRAPLGPRRQRVHRPAQRLRPDPSSATATRFVNDAALQAQLAHAASRLGPQTPLAGEAARARLRAHRHGARELRLHRLRGRAGRALRIARTVHRAQQGRALRRRTTTATSTRCSCAGSPTRRDGSSPCRAPRASRQRASPT
jgi:acyl carrier protein